MNMSAWALRALMRAENSQHKLPDQIMEIPGMTGAKIAYFLNAVCDNQAINFLEIGSFQGATLLSAAYHNLGQFTAIDNFSLAPGTADALFANLEKFKEDCKVKFHRADCWKIDLDLLPDGINVYFYDGDHSEESQAKALTRFAPKMAHEFIYVVDDCSSQKVQLGTLRGIAQAGLKSRSITIMTGDFSPSAADNHRNWWNGLGVFVLEKNGGNHGKRCNREPADCGFNGEPHSHQLHQDPENSLGRAGGQ